MPKLVAVTPLGEKVDVGPALSVFDPMYIGIDEFGHPIYLPMLYHNILIGGQPGAGKSSLLLEIVAHAGLDPNCRLVLLDGKRVELGLWKSCAGVFVGPHIDHALTTLRRVQKVIDNRSEYLELYGRRKTRPGDVFSPILVAIDLCRTWNYADRRPRLGRRSLRRWAPRGRDLSGARHSHTTGGPAGGDRSS
jgi:S-DNA-T family DNA segregation ATPase FtsK/SpoIIIE